MTQRLSRRQLLKAGAAGTAYTLLATAPRFAFAASFDVVVTGGSILDGTGSPAWTADIGIVGDTIREIGAIPAESGKRVIDAVGHCVAPGFIDMHTHSDDSIFRYPGAESRVYQGITTEVTGNCGSSAAPLEGTAGDESRHSFQREYGFEAKWTDVASYFEALQTLGPSLNHAFLVGQGTLRSTISGDDNRLLDAAELKRLLRAVEEALDAGAFGMSTGLEYVPGRFTPVEEIIAMARAVARRGGIYSSHIRNEEAGLLEAVEEAIRIGRESGARVQISHLKAAGRPNWSNQDAALSLIETARRKGVDVLADAYPYPAYSTGLTILVPDWALDGGWPALAKRLADAAARARIRDEVEDSVKGDPGAFNLIVISSVTTQRNRPLVGKNLEQIAADRGKPPAEVLLELLIEEDGSVGFIGHGMDPDNVRLVLGHPLVMIGSDGGSMAPEGPAGETRPHPRSYGTFPRVLGYYSRELKLFDLATAVKKMTSMPADQLGLSDRGRVAKGMKADLVVFDPTSVRDAATFDNPHQYPLGIPHVLVNGQLVIDRGRHTGARPGRVLKRA